MSRPESRGWGTRDPVEHWRRFQRDAVRDRTLRGLYVLRQTGRFTYRGHPATDLLYTRTGADQRRMRVQGRAFTANGHQCTILFAAPEKAWPKHAPVVDEIFTSFQQKH